VVTLETLESGASLVLAIVSLAVFYISLAPITANALAVERVHVARNFNYAHAGIARKKRGDSGNSGKRCKPRPASEHTPSSISSSHTTSSSSHHPSSSPEPKVNPAKVQPPHATTSSHHPAVTPVASSNSGSAGVVGLAWSNNEQPSICNFKTSHTNLVYNWKLEKYTDVDVSKCGFEFIPQVWGAQDVYQVPQTLVRGYAQKVMFLNEPDQSSQSNMGVAEAVQLFMQYINPLQWLGYEIIGPACTNAPAGTKWTRDFVTAVRNQGGKIDAVATHFYGVYSADFIQFMESFIALFPNDRIYLTEFAAQDYSGHNVVLDYAQIQVFLQETTGYMRGKSEIVAYFWFGAMTADELAANHVNGLNSLMSNSAPNQLGNIYLNP